MKAKETKIAKETTVELLGLLGIESTFDISLKDEEGIDIILNTEDSGVVIGYHGETLEALQLILSLCIAKRIGRFVRVSIEVGDYKKNRTEYLNNLANETKERVIEEGREITIPNLKSWERRIIHLMLEADKEVLTESQGEGRDRVLVVKPRE